MKFLFSHRIVSIYIATSETALVSLGGENEETPEEKELVLEGKDEAPEEKGALEEGCQP